MRRARPGLPILSTAVLAVILWSSAGAQSPRLKVAPAGGRGVPQVCALLTETEVQTLINRGQKAYGEPETVALKDGGAICEYPIGAQVVLFPGPNAERGLEALIRNFGKQGEVRKPVAGIGDRAWIMFPTPRDRNEDRLAYLVTYAGQYAIAVSMAAKEGQANGVMAEYCRQGKLSKAECAKIEKDKGETPQSLQPAVEAVARAVLAKLR